MLVAAAAVRVAWTLVTGQTPDTGDTLVLDHSSLVNTRTSLVTREETQSAHTNDNTGQQDTTTQELTWGLFLLIKSD